MNHVKQLVSLVLAVAIACSAMTLTAFAANGERYSVSSATASEHNQKVEEKKQSINDTYGVSIHYPTTSLNGVDVAAIYVETLETLETALSYVTPSVVRNVSSHYYDKTGKRLRIHYRFADLTGPYGGNSEEVVRAGFDPDEGLMVLYIPRPGEGAVTSGDEPMTIVHEFGHAVHMMLADQYGATKLEQEWVALNQGYSYNAANIAQNPSDQVFVSGYAATEFHEDVAETFAHVFVRNRTGMGFSNKLGTAEAPTALRRKVAIWEKLLNTYFPNATAMQENFQKVYTNSNSASYNGITISGDRLQFMGYAEPRYMPLGTLKELGIAESSYKWLSAIGGWTAPDGTGKTVIVFTDGSWGSTDKTIS